jgi:hypothetical protein
MFQKVFGLSDQNRQEIEFMKESAHLLNREIFETFGQVAPSPMSTFAQWDQAFTNVLQTACQIKQNQWKGECFHFIYGTCRTETFNLGPLVDFVALHGHRHLLQIGTLFVSTIGFARCGEILFHEL